MNDLTPNLSAAYAGRTVRRRRGAWDAGKKALLKSMWLANDSVDEIADLLATSPSNVYSWAHRLGLPRRSPRGVPLNGKRRKQRVHRADPTGLRRKTRLAPTTGPRIILEPYDPRARAGTTVFPTSVLPASKMVRLLKSGHNSFKIGKTVAKGRLRGAPIFTLTLEERATCPRTCMVWSTCYGNNMPFAQRIWDDGTLTRRLWGELASLQAENPNGFLVRLHVLGDFYSTDYVQFWRQAFDDFPALNVFGFTARRTPDPIGNAIAELARDQYERFRVRFSGLAMEQDGAVVVDRREDAIGVLCPAEQDPDRCCASCALCWHSNKTISFMRH